MARGHTNRQIADDLVLSAPGQNVHRIISKPGVSDRTQAAVRATELRLLVG